MIGLPPQFEHERYEELCALASAGALTAAESEALFSHLDECADCSKHFAEYQSLASEGMPLLVDLHKPTPDADGFDERNALARLLKSARSLQSDTPRIAFSHSQSWTLWRGITAATLLVAVALSSYKLGEFRRRNPIEQSNVSIPSAPSAANVNRERQSLEASLEDAKRREVDLQAIASERGTELEKLRADAKIAQERLDTLTASLTTTEANTAAQVQALAAQRDASVVKLQEAERRSLNAQNELNTLRAQREQDVVRISSLESQVGGLTVAMNEQGHRAKDDEQYLASDKDIRDLIGARNLYIADIMDVREDGSARKPFGRVFYTKTKSLIFYAYDLDRQPGVKRASTFQVWGRTGPDDRKPINLGVLYLDSESNRRWALRVDNPEQLARLDAVFVTVEQREQTDKPTGKPFLYASLRREPNHL
jgi:hypothetical protein